MTFYSSLLIVYEGYEVQQQSEPSSECYLSKTHLLTDQIVEKAKSLEDDTYNGGNCSYDADASNDSIELNLSLHEDSDNTMDNNKLPRNYQQRKQQQQQQPHSNFVNSVLPSTTEATYINHSVTTSNVPSASSITLPEPRPLVESIVRGALNTTKPFVPISEDTVFLDTDPIVSSSGISTMSSPMSCDSWMNYSSNSSDDLSCISDHIHVQHEHDSSEESSIEYDAPTENAQSTPKFKRNFNSILLTGNGGDNNKSSLNSNDTTVYPAAIPKTIVKNYDENGKIITGNSRHDDDLCSSSGGGQTKRLRSKDSSATAATAVLSGSTKRKSLLLRNGSLSGAVCDIRMIDFAHTTFKRKNVNSSTSTSLTANTSSTVQHQGPDNGFLRGIESLKRLLNEIQNDELDN